MTGFALFMWLLAALMITQGLFLAIAPKHAVRYTLWKVRLIGARVAEPGRSTFAFYRIQGIAIIAVALFVIFQLLSE